MHCPFEDGNSPFQPILLVRNITILKNEVDVVVCRNRQKLYKQYTNIYKPYTYQQITHALYHCHSPWLESHCTRCPATGMSIKNRTKKEERGECKTTTYRTKRTTKMTQKNYRKLQKLHQILYIWKTHKNHFRKWLFNDNLHSQLLKVGFSEVSRYPWRSPNGLKTYRPPGPSRPSQGPSPLVPHLQLCPPKPRLSSESPCPPRTDGNSPLCSIGHRPLQVRYPA